MMALQTPIPPWALEGMSTLIRRADGSLPDPALVLFGTACAVGGLLIGTSMAWQGLRQACSLAGLVPRPSNSGGFLATLVGGVVAIAIGSSVGTAGAMALWGLVRTTHLG